MSDNIVFVINMHLKKDFFLNCTPLIGLMWGCCSYVVSSIEFLDSVNIEMWGYLVWYVGNCDNGVRHREGTVSNVCVSEMSHVFDFDFASRVTHINFGHLDTLDSKLSLYCDATQGKDLTW